MLRYVAHFSKSHCSLHDLWWHSSSEHYRWQPLQGGSVVDICLLYVSRYTEQELDTSTADTTRSHNAGLMLVQRLRRWTDINTALVRRLG